MKRLFLFFLLSALITGLKGQSHGITYQAVIIDTENKELPGFDLSGSYMPYQSLTVRFTIIDSNGTTLYQEEQETQTDQYGMINLTIGAGSTTSQSPGIFEEIDWNGTLMDLAVEISIEGTGSGFRELSLQSLNFVPYAYHRNITATGTLIVDGPTTLNNSLTVTGGNPTNLSGSLSVEGLTTFRDLTVNGVTNLEGILNVNNGSPAALSGTLGVAGMSTLSDLTVNGPAGFSNSLAVNNGSPVTLSGSLGVTGNTSLDGSLTVNSLSGFNGQVTINADVNGTDNLYNSYPLRVEGSNQGIAVRIDGNRNSNNNFITFWDASGIQGRIEGQTGTDLLSETQYIFDQSLFAAQVIVQGVNLATAVAASVIDPGNAIIEAANSIALAAEITAYNVFAFSNLGVTYESGSGDYAEWLPRLYPEEEIKPGQVVGVYGGRITKQTENADLLMVVSSSPIVLGNMPSDTLNSHLYEKVGFMGQVPVWVVGEVREGDYIVGYASNSGLGMAVAPDDLTVEMMPLIVGRAWTSSSDSRVKQVNTVIGVKTNEWVGFIRESTKELELLKAEIEQLKKMSEKSGQVLAGLVPGYKEAMGEPGEKESDILKVGAADPVMQKSAPVPAIPVMTRELILGNLTKAAEIFRQQGYDPSTNPFYSRLNSDHEYRDKVVEEIFKAYENYRLNVGGE